MLIPVNGTPGNLDPFANSIIHRSVSDYDIAPLTKSWDHTANRRKGLSVDNARWRAEMSCNIGFGFDMYILSAVEARRRARTYAVGTQYLYSLFFESFVRDKIVEIV